MASLNEAEIEVSIKSVWASADTVAMWDPSDANQQNRNKRTDTLLLIAKAFGWCSRLDLLCSYQKLKLLKTILPSGLSSS